MSRRHLGVVAAITLVLAGLFGTSVWAWSGGLGGRGMMPGGYGLTRDGPGMMGGGSSMMGDGAGMMGDAPYGEAGTGPVTSLGLARSQALRFADRLGLRVGEVMRFSNGFYAELRTPAGTGGTEVLVDAADGDVHIEYGPAMMWNLEYGPHASGSTQPARVSAEEARRLADRWLRTRGGGVGAGEPEAFPGYYTLHTLRDGKITGMLSVNAYSGAVWYHSWHGRFLDMSEE